MSRSSVIAIAGLALLFAAEAQTQQSAEPQTVADIDNPWLRTGQVGEWTGDLDGMIERGFIRMLTPVNRTDYFVDGAVERGINAEYANALEEFVNRGRDARDHVRVVVLPVHRDQLLPMLTEGRGDIASGGLTITPERREIVDFSPPFITGVSELVVTGPGVEPVAKFEDLSGREIWVRASSSYYQSLLEANEAFLATGLAPIDVRTADARLKDEGLLEMVNAGLYPATVADSHKLEWVWSKVFDQITVSNVAVREDGELAVAIRKGSPLLHALMSEFRLGNRRGTLFGNIMIRRYATNSRWVQDASSTDDRQRFDAVVELFRKYSEEYGFDYLMMIAQGYQESGLDPNARSSVGAIGIMQVMPETAAGRPIFMDNVESPDDNIMAGIKYMRYLVDQFFNDPGIDEVNRHLFAFAAYNAGPNRVARLRKQAPEYGLDPNKWFKNVEHIVASNVGREPVRYVGNIYKYYLAYQRLREIEREQSRFPPPDAAATEEADPTSATPPRPQAVRAVPRNGG